MPRFRLFDPESRPSKPKDPTKRRSTIDDFPAWLKVAMQYTFNHSTNFGGGAEFCRRYDHWDCEGSSRGPARACKCLSCKTPTNIYDNHMSGLDEELTLSEIEQDMNLSANEDEREAIACYCDIDAWDCKCGPKDSECDCLLEEEDNWSHAGSLYEEYDNHNFSREKRKRELKIGKFIKKNGEKAYQAKCATVKSNHLARREKAKARKVEKFETAKAELLAQNESYEKKVQAVYATLKDSRKAGEKGEKLPFKDMVGQRFRLYSSDMVKFDSYDDAYPPVQFSDQIHEVELLLSKDSACEEQEEPEGKSRVLCARIVIHDTPVFGTANFKLPKRARRKARKVRADEGKYDVSIQFIGKRCLKLHIQKALFDRIIIPDDHIPDVLEFCGVWHGPAT
ncbi:hypothetical protein BT63DRAFT_416361 [Microthyrium microscopicum]|uniref:Uncharacterized protein n=1 Tax=Microthyrium microscopicum TaxID=703497 RepID=A0A6A6U3C7_9PEZI|nr:hypothetical protein BT63DRAFT_416361 [Microthyrium microscopicum]